MQTPNTKAGKLTERIMWKVRLKLPDLPTHAYNRVYETVLEELSSQIPDIPVPASLHPDIAWPKIVEWLKNDNTEPI